MMEAASLEKGAVRTQLHNNKGTVHSVMMVKHGAAWHDRLHTAGSCTPGRDAETGGMLIRLTCA